MSMIGQETRSQNSDVSDTSEFTRQLLWMRMLYRQAANATQCFESSQQCHDEEGERRAEQKLAGALTLLDAGLLWFQEIGIGVIIGAGEGSFVLRQECDEGPPLYYDVMTCGDGTTIEVIPMAQPPCFQA
jgi:hypothetical protein